MKKIEQIYREILHQSIEEKNRKLTQKYLSKTLNVSLSTVNYALSPLRDMGSIEIKQRNFNIIEPKKILYYWASIRNINNDVIFKTRVNNTITAIEKSMPPKIIFTAYSAYKFIFKETPADYSEIYVYADNLNEIKRRFQLSKNHPNLFVLKKDNNLKKLTLANLFVDLWNLKEWYARDFLKTLEAKIDGILA